MKEMRRASEQKGAGERETDLQFLVPAPFEA